MCSPTLSYPLSISKSSLKKTSLSVVRTFDGRVFCLSTSLNRSSVVALPALDLIIVTENDEPLGREDFRRPGVLSFYLCEQKQ